MTEKLIVRRKIPESTILDDSLHPLLQKLYLARGIKTQEELEKGLAKLAPFHLLKNIDDAANLLFTAMQTQKKIVVIGDFDADGATSTALVLLAMRKMGYHNIDYLIPDRFKQGYGLSVDVVKMAIEKKADLIITVDNGISSFDGVDYANANAIQTLITDHHLPAETLPQATCIINPNLPQCTFPSKSLAGVGVAFYMMLALRALLREKKWFSENNVPEYNLAELLDLVALGTVADLVSLDFNNRILVHQGLNRIRANQCRVGIQMLIQTAKKDGKKLACSDLGYLIAPRLNAAGRLDDMSIGVELLLCDDETKARDLAKQLDELNTERRKIERSMKNDAEILCDNIKHDLGDTLPNVITLYHPTWHQGVIGILASRLKEQFFRPTIIFADAENGFIKGSGRSIPSLHLRDTLALLDTRYPHLIHAFGGHAMAAGLTIKNDDFECFKAYFDALIDELLDPHHLNNEIITDGEIENALLSINTAEMLQQNGLWGQGFPEPLFDGTFTLLQQQLIAEKHLKMALTPINGGPVIDAIMFNVDRKCWPNPLINKAHLVYRLNINEYNGNRKLQLIVDHIWSE